MSIIGVIFLSVAVIFVTAFLFVGWVIFNIIRTLVRTLTSIRPPRLLHGVAARINAGPGMLRCARENCGNLNPPTARFCKCCGANLLAAGNRQPRVAPVRMRVSA